MKDNKNTTNNQSRSFASAMFLFLTFLIALAFVVKTGDGSETLSYFGAKDYVTAEIKVKGVQLRVYQDLGEGYQDVTETGFDLATQYFVPDKTYRYDLIIKNDEKATVKAEDFYLRWWFTANIDGTDYDITDYCTVDSAFVYKQNDTDGKTRFYSVNGLYSNVISAQNQLTFLSKLKFKSEYNNTTNSYISILDKEASGSKVKITAHIEGSLDSYEILKPKTTFYTETGEVLYEEGTEDSTTIKIPKTLPSSSITENGTTLYFQGWIKNGVSGVIYTPNEEVEVEEGDVFTPYYAQDPDYSNFTFTIDSVTGEYILAGANKNITSAEIPALTQGQIVSVVQTSAFYSYSSLQTVTLPQTITKIGTSAFYNCTSLTSINIPDSVKTIDKYAFCRCSSLTSIDLNNVESIGRSVFSATYITSINIPATVSNIVSGAFGETFSLETITVDENSQYYVAENNILYNKAKTILVKAGVKVSNPTLPTSLKIINVRAFYKNMGTVLTLNEGLEEIEERAFENAYLTTLHLPSTLKTIGDNALYSLTTRSKITLADENINFVIENGVLYNNGKTRIIRCADPTITSYVMPDSVKYMDEAAFFNTDLKSVTLNRNIEEIPFIAFYYCTGLTGDITIYSNTKKISNRAFAHTAVTSITFENTTGWYATSSSSYNNGTSIDVSNPTTNATNLNNPGIWYTKYLYRS